MKTTLTIALFTYTLMQSAFGQTDQSSNIKNECFANNNYQHNAVKEFKNELTLKLEINKLKVDKSSHKIAFSYSEKIKNESSLIQINDSIAFKISISRVIDFKAKKYLYKADLFRKSENCWKVSSASNYWYEFFPGVVSSGLGFGYEGNINYLGFDGVLVLE